MKKEIRIKTLEELINQPREGKFDTYEFDELSYTCLLCDIRMIILENKRYKEVIDKAILELANIDGNLSNSQLSDRICNLIDILSEVE